MFQIRLFIKKSGKMKTIHKLIPVVALVMLLINSVQSQGWVQNKKGMYSAGIGAASAVFIPVYDYPGPWPLFPGRFF